MLPQNTTYSFADVIAVISPVGFAPATINGQGIGEISVDYDNENTSQNLAADGSVMTSKIVANNGTITISCQQTSNLHKWFKSCFNYLMQAPTSVWAGTSINISSPLGLNDIVSCTGVAFAKRSNQPYQQQGQMVTWTFKAANIQFQLGGLGTAINTIL